MTDMLDLIEAFANYVQNERVKSFNEGVDAERARCARIADGEIDPEFPSDAVSCHARTIAAYIRSGAMPGASGEEAR